LTSPLSVDIIILFEEEALVGSATVPTIPKNRRAQSSALRRNLAKEEDMRWLVFVLALTVALSFTAAFAQIKPCEELKGEIEAKLKAKGVEGYTIEIIPADQVKDQTIIGSCEGGTKKISYSREKAK
jgi:hypothetical protein